MTVRELINKLLDEPMDREILLCCEKENIDERGNKCDGYIFDIDGVKNGEIMFTDWRDRKESEESMNGKRNVIRKTNKTKNIYELSDLDGFICEECGIQLKDWIRYETDEEREDEYCYEYAFRYCPNCGRKVVEE